MGGPGILDNCIVAIADRPGHFIYKHPKLDLGEWETGKPQSDGYLSAAYCNGELTAQFKTSKGAANYIGFMIGQRFCK